MERRDSGGGTWPPSPDEAEPDATPESSKKAAPDAPAKVEEAAATIAEPPSELDEDRRPSLTTGGKLFVPLGTAELLLRLGHLGPVARRAEGPQVTPPVGAAPAGVTELIGPDGAQLVAQGMLVVELALFGGAVNPVEIARLGAG